MVYQSLSGCSDVWYVQGGQIIHIQHPVLGSGTFLCGWSKLKVSATVVAGSPLNTARWRF